MAGTTRHGEPTVNLWQARSAGRGRREDDPQRSVFGVLRAPPRPGARGAGGEIAERVRRSREGLLTAARRRLARLFGLEKLSPARQVLTLFAVAVESSLLLLSLFTDLPSSWLLTTALLVLPFLLHYVQKGDEEGAGTAAANRAWDAARRAGGVARRPGHRRRT